MIYIHFSLKNLKQISTQKNNNTAPLFFVCKWHAKKEDPHSYSLLVWKLPFWKRCLLYFVFNFMVAPFNFIGVRLQQKKFS